ncbi:MAG: dethiobiotin synthetase, partial [Solirubrobacteraceae bacterium]|nr:dethiobiotin synthetase [Solirubrobacteraceae bacterium]
MIVVTGTDTGVGKTIVCAAIAAITGLPYVKAAQTGDDDDAAEVARLAGAEVRTLARFADPLAPASAGAGITAGEVAGEVRGVAVVEGAGGLL